jgi:acyl transferase domain-containing protein
LSVAADWGIKTGIPFDPPFTIISYNTTDVGLQALVGRANMILHPNFISQLSSMHMLSPNGISHLFDARANGYAHGEAISTVLIKRLKDVLADGDTIQAVVRGSGVNQDGHTPGIIMPSSEAKAALVRSTYAAAGLSYEETGHFEAHGTATRLGIRRPDSFLILTSS